MTWRDVWRKNDVMVAGKRIRKSKRHGGGGGGRV